MTLLKLTAKERYALAELGKPVGQRDYSRVHGRTRHALERKGLFGSNGKPGGSITPAGRTELVVPNIFDDLFANKEAAMPKPTFSEFRPIEHVTTELYDPERAGWVLGDGSQTDGLRLYCTQSPSFGEKARWLLQIRAWVKKKTGGRGKHFAVSSASLSREDLLWLRGQINAELRRKS
jgi:hypothetical protein